MQTVIYVMSCSLSLLTMLIVTDGIMMLSVMYSMYCTLLAREKDGSMVIWNCHCIYWGLFPIRSHNTRAYSSGCGKLVGFLPGL